jgi:hypothetical protein
LLAEQRKRSAYDLFSEGSMSLNSILTFVRVIISVEIIEAIRVIPILGIDNEIGGLETSVLLDCCIRPLCSNRA